MRYPFAMHRLRFAFLALLFCCPPPAGANSAEAPGYADLHNHMFAEHAFGGAWLHGSVEGVLAEALSPCEAHFDPFGTGGTHGEVKIPFLSALIGRIPGSAGDTGPHWNRAEGHPSFRDWPRWDTIAHQQVWSGHLEKAKNQGLDLLVVSLVNFEPLCELMVEKNKKFKDCSDSAAIERQLDAAEAFQARHSWFRIVTTPAEARAEITKGNLAVVLSIEASHIFGDGPWKPEFERAFDRGVRTLQFVHQYDNRFGGAAIHHPVFRFLFWLQDFRAHGHWWELLTPSKFGFQTDRDPATGTETNRAGLTEEGKEVVRALMKRGMPIDIAHLSEQSVRDVLEITRPSRYPIYVSHGHFRKAMNDGKFSVYEKSSPDWVLDEIRLSGGVFGLRTGPEKTHAIENAGTPNDCQGSSKSYAQTYAYGRNRGLAVGFSTDMNGFIQQTRPRFGNADETCGAETDARERTLQQKSQKTRSARASTTQASARSESFRIFSRT